MLQQKGDQFLTLKKSFPHVVPLALCGEQLHVPPEPFVAVPHDDRILRIGHQRVLIAMDMEHAHSRLRQRRQAVDRIVQRQQAFHLSEFESVGFCRSLKPRVSAQIAHRIDRRDGCHLVRILDSPVIQHQSAATARQQAGLCGEAVLLREDFVKRGVNPAAFGIPHRLTHIDSRDSHAGREQSLKHPVLFLTWIRRQGRCVENPRCCIRPWPACVRLEEEPTVAVDLDGHRLYAQPSQITPTCRPGGHR